MATRVDMHCHSTASQVSKLGVQRALGLPECATPPEEVYELAKRRGMDFVTITDHDTIDGVLKIADRPDVFVSEELTAHFRGEPQAVHVLCYGITAADHEWLQANSGDVELCAMYLYDREIACALAHPYYAVGAPLTARHRRRLAELFDIWETRNGARARELNRPAAMYVATLDGTGIGGSDDHAGIDIGRTWTEAPDAGAPTEFLQHMRAGRVAAHGKQGSAAKWAHAAIALAARSLGHDASDGVSATPDPQRVMTMVQRLLSEGDAREGSHRLRRGARRRTLPVARMACRRGARPPRRAWADLLHARGRLQPLRPLPPRLSDARAQAGGCGWARHRGDCGRDRGRSWQRRRRHETDEHEPSQHIEPPSQAGLFESCIAAIPYAPATAFLANEQAKLARTGVSADGEPPRVAILADGIGSTHGVSRTIEEIRQRGVPGFEIEVVATDPEVDRRLSAVAEFDVPFYPGLRIGVPSLSAAVQTLADGAFDAIHVCSPGPTGVAGALLGRALGLPLIGSYHTELTAYAQLRSGQQHLAEAMEMAVGAFYNACDLVLSPSPASDEALASIGMSAEKILRWDRGVDTSRFDPSLRSDALREIWMEGMACPEHSQAQARVTDPLLSGRECPRVNVLYAGRITREKGAELLAEAFLGAREQDPRLHLVLAGGGPEQERLRERVGKHATFLGWLRGEELASAYASADIFFFPSATDTFGQVILEAQASGLPVLAVAAGGPLELIEDRVTGLLRDADSAQLASALVELAGSPSLRECLAGAALAAVRERTWERALERLADGYRRALPGHAGEAQHSQEVDRLVA